MLSSFAANVKDKVLAATSKTEIGKEFVVLRLTFSII
tara:strand:- start:419 stop:529 length:111 start_codon:yes stop_codon:yes gene_type:complete